MKNTYHSELMKKLWELSGEIGNKDETENDKRYFEIYKILCLALDKAEDIGLINCVEDEEN